MSDGRFEIADTPIAGLKRVSRRRIGDERGFLSRLYCANDLAAAGFTAPVVQINHTLTQAKGTIRGMHFQHAPRAEDKFVSCLRGEVLDVAVDLRDGSTTFLHWHGERLSADNGVSLFIPRGFAHGFQTLSEDCELLYLHTAPYDRGSEGGVNPLDPRLTIDWPLPITEMSERDRRHPLLADADFIGIQL